MGIFLLFGNGKTIRGVGDLFRNRSQRLKIMSDLRPGLKELEQNPITGDGVAALQWFVRQHAHEGR
jgi:hypothetical protein